MFETEDQARAEFKGLLENHPNIRKLIGDHLARVALHREHGRQTETDETGHFDLHEYDGVNLVTVSLIVGTL